MTGQLTMPLDAPPPPPPMPSDTLPVPTRVLAAFGATLLARGDKAAANAIGTAVFQAGRAETIRVSRALVESWGIEW